MLDHKEKEKEKFLLHIIFGLEPGTYFFSSTYKWRTQLARHWLKGKGMPLMHRQIERNGYFRAKSLLDLPESEVERNNYRLAVKQENVGHVL